MQHKEWQEFIPFYVAQSLPPDDVRRFEAHLASCETCQQEIDEWRMIASAVWREADSAVRELPPLSQDVYNRLNYRDRPPESRYSANPPVTRDKQTPSNVRSIPQRRSYFPVTLVAGIVVAVFFGGLLMFLALNQTNDAQQEQAIAAAPTGGVGSGDVAAGAMMADDDTVADEALEMQAQSGTAFSGLIPTLVPESDAPVFSSNTPSAPPVMAQAEMADSSVAARAVEEESAEDADFAEPETLAMGGGMPDSRMPAGTPTPLPTPDPNLANTGFTLAQPNDVPPPGTGPHITVTPGITFADGSPLCEVFNPTSVQLELFLRADRTSGIVAALNPGDVKRVVARSNTGWYLITVDATTQGWLQMSNAYLRGNCVDVLPLATVIPTATRFVPATPTPQTSNEFPNEDRVVVVATAFADLYEGPTYSSTIIAVAERGDQFPVIGYQGIEPDRWVLVQLADGGRAWLASSIVNDYAADDVP